LSGVVDEKDERAYVNPDDTIFNALLGNSPFHDVHLTLLGARFYSVDLSLRSARSFASHWSSSPKSLATLLLAGSDAVGLLTPLWRADTLHWIAVNC